MSDRRSSVEALLAFFDFRHLPPGLKLVCKPFRDLAIEVANGPQNDETIACLRKLLEAKDCAVRAAL